MVVSAFKRKNVSEKVIVKGDVYLKLVGLQLDGNDRTRTFVGRLRIRRFFVFTFFCLNLDWTGQLTWLIGSFLNRNNDLIDITFVIPCLIVTLMGSVKSLYFVKYAHHVHDVITTLKNIKLVRTRKKTEKENEFEKRSLQFLNAANKIITWASILAIATFGFGPLLLMARFYYNTGEIKLFYPFLFYYPFNAFDIRVWPFLYAQQVLSAIIAVCTIWGPDYVCYAVSTLMMIQFFLLKQDIICLIRQSNKQEIFVVNNEYREKIRDVVKCHNQLLRCGYLMEATYTKTILFNVIASSILICFCVFNITINDSIIFMAPFTAFLIMVLGQIFLLCYFGDMIIRISTEVSDAIYECQWYVAERRVIKDLIMICNRAHMPSKLTAYGFADVNLITFTKILSKSWSIFALLQTLCDNKIIQSKIQ